MLSAVRNTLSMGMKTRSQLEKKQLITAGRKWEGNCHRTVTERATAAINTAIFKRKSFRQVPHLLFHTVCHFVVERQGNTVLISAQPMLLGDQETTDLYCSVLFGFVLILTSDCLYYRYCAQKENLKNMVQVRDLSHSTSRKIMWELDFHNNILQFGLQWILRSFFVLMLLFWNLKAEAVMKWEGVAQETDIWWVQGN